MPRPIPPIPHGTGCLARMRGWKAGTCLCPGFRADIGSCPCARIVNNDRDPYLTLPMTSLPRHHRRDERKQRNATLIQTAFRTQTPNNRPSTPTTSANNIAIAACKPCLFSDEKSLHLQYLVAAPRKEQTRTLGHHWCRAEILY